MADVNPYEARPDPQYILSDTPAALVYWASVLKRCDASNCLYENQFGGRDVFALGSVIIKSSHLHSNPSAERDYTFADQNEVAAIKVARTVLPATVHVPDIYFAGTIDGLGVLVQERIAGVALCVAWQYISAAQKTSFKAQARALLCAMRKAQPPAGNGDGDGARSYVVPDADPVKHKNIQQAEYDMLFGRHDADDDDDDGDVSFMHNDFSQSNCIVNNDKIVGLVDWEMSGYLGWRAAARVHVGIRCPRRENYVSLNLDRDMLEDIFFWNDLYEV